MKHLIFIIALIACLAPTALSCSMLRLPEPAMSKSNVKSYIFVGEVIGYTDVIKSRVKPNGFETEDKFYGEGRGVKIKPVEVINLPKVPNDYFELYKFGVTTWCANKLADVSYMKIGTRIRIVAYEATLLPNNPNDNHIRIESKIFDRFSIVKDDEEFVSIAASEFDYKNNWKSLRNKLLAAKDYERIIAFDDFIYLETNKDLLRLKNSTSKKQRYKILERLLYNPKVDFSALISPSLGEGIFLLQLSGKPGKEKQIKLTSKEKELLKRRKELLASGFFKL
jgi:hypothetical protein